MVFILTWLIAGSLDLTAAVLFFISTTKQHPAVLIKAITSAALGPGAFNGGAGMVILGLIFHYLIAMIWTAFYFLVFSYWYREVSVFAGALAYGMFVWVIMNLVVLPLSKVQPRPFSPIAALINIVILILAIGVPCAYASKYFPISLFTF